MNTVTFTIPIPAACLNPNARSHWGKKHTARAEQRLIAATYSGEKFRGPGPKWARAKLIVRWFAKDDHRIPDIDNAIASLKGAIDGICDAYIILNDRGIESIDLWRVVDKQSPRVEITITETTK